MRISPLVHSLAVDLMKQDSSLTMAEAIALASLPIVARAAIMIDRERENFLESLDNRKIVPKLEKS